MLLSLQELPEERPTAQALLESPVVRKYTRSLDMLSDNRFEAIVVLMYLMVFVFIFCQVLKVWLLLIMEEALISPNLVVENLCC